MLWPRPHALDHAPMPWPRPLSTPQRWPRSVSPWPRPCPSPIRCLRPDSSPFSWPRPLGGPAPGAMAVSEPAGSSWAAPGRAGSVPGSEPGPPGAPGAPGAGCGPGPCWAAVLACLSLACCYVGSLYVWGSPLPRVLLVSGLAPALVWLWREHSGIKAEWSLPALLGLRLEGLLPATLLPLLLTMILFLGPLIQLSMDCSWRWSHGLRAALAPRSWLRFLGDVRWLRNQVVAPVTEELVFRACMLPMLLPCAGHRGALLACPLFFALAHFHHVIEQLRFRQGSLGSILVAAGTGGLGRSSSPTPLCSVPTPPSSSCAQVTWRGRLSVIPSVTRWGSRRWGRRWVTPAGGRCCPATWGGCCCSCCCCGPSHTPRSSGGAPPRPRPPPAPDPGLGGSPLPPPSPDPGLGGSPLPPPSPDPGLGGPPLLTLTRDWGDPPSPCLFLTPGLGGPPLLTLTRDWGDPLCPPLAPDPGIGGIPSPDPELGGPPPPSPDPGLGGSPLPPPHSFTPGLVGPPLLTLTRDWGDPPS
ncbi:CAAX prenyl protease 2 isoform X2 [Patagioenas fasciata]|uniref:CAAX prenyl protease 2 isoform X2 n=1 Tax=Patagioenas fasciata TaxID=372321 RepID=UPI003A98EAB0